MPDLYELRRTIDALTVFPSQLKSFFDSFPVDSQSWAPPSWEGIPSESLTAIEHISHVLDVEIEGYKVRFNRIRSEIAPVLPDLPGELMAAQRRYVNYDAATVLSSLASARVETIETIRSFTPKELDRVGVFEGARTTLAGLVHFLCSHDQQHLAGLQWLLAKLQQARAGT